MPQSAGIVLPMRNATMADLSGVLQATVLDRPAVNDTGLTGKYDFAMTFMSDDSEFDGHPPMINGAAPRADAPDAAPNLFRAIQEPLGLKL